MKRILFAATALVLIVAFFLGAKYYKDRRAAELGFMAQEQASTFVRPHSPVLGSDDAKVYIVKFTDPACETCASFSPFIKQAMDAFPGQIKFVIRYAPFHEGADGVARILEAARKQGKFWETLELLYRRQATWTVHHRVVLSQVWPLLTEVGLDIERVKADMNDPHITSLLEQDLADAEALGVRKTPGFFVNGKPLEPFGSRPLAELIKAEIREKYPE
ncbi:MAG: thioredoxin domain-containing protein [Candidatus Latescibacteria bacterium]|nr:thioredoxin domain-containing protein [Candidatus Latescibacterota bacterium]